MKRIVLMALVLTTSVVRGAAAVGPPPPQPTYEAEMARILGLMDPLYVPSELPEFLAVTDPPEDRRHRSNAISKGDMLSAPVTIRTEPRQ